MITTHWQAVKWAHVTIIMINPPHFFPLSILQFAGNWKTQEGRGSCPCSSQWPTCTSLPVCRPRFWGRAAQCSQRGRILWCVRNGIPVGRDGAPARSQRDSFSIGWKPWSRPTGMYAQCRPPSLCAEVLSVCALQLKTRHGHSRVITCTLHYLPHYFWRIVSYMYM